MSYNRYSQYQTYGNYGNYGNYGMLGNYGLLYQPSYVKPKVVIPITPNVLALPKGEYGKPSAFP
jgi:hypothetical protein